MEVYNHDRRRPLKSVEGTVEHFQISPYSEAKTEKVSKFWLEGDKRVFVFAEVEEIRGRVRVHFDKHTRDYAIVACVELLDRGYAILGKGYSCMD